MSNMAIEGLISGFNTTELIESILELQVRGPIEGLEKKATKETEKLASFQALNANMLSLDIAAQTISSQNLFNGKQAFSSNESILTASASSSAKAGAYNLRVNNLAKSDQLSSDMFASATDELNYSGNFVINGRGLSVSSTDTLATIATKINGANVGVRASIVQVAPNQNKLVLGSTSTGVDKIELRDGASNVLNSLGLVDNSPANMTYDYTVNADTYGALGEKFDLTDIFSTTGKGFTVTDAGGMHTMTVNFASDMTLEQIRDEINTTSDAQGANFNAEVVEDGGQYRLRIASDTGIPTNFNDQDNVLFDLGIANGIQSEDFASATASIGDLLNLGATTPQTIELSDGDGSNPISISVDFDTDSLTDIKDKLDTAIGLEIGSDLSVNIITVNGRSRLEITSDSGQPVFNVAADAGNVFETLGLADAKFKNFDQQGQNSQFQFNGVTINRDGNLVTDLVDGVSFALTKESSELVTVNIREDYEGVDTSIESFVTAYNSVIDFINEQTYYNPQTREKGILFGQSTIRSLEDSLSAQMAQLIPDMPGAKVMELNNGRGMDLGSINITNRAGVSQDIDLNGVQTVQDILDAINLTQGLGVRAAINNNGTSINLTDTSDGYGSLTISEVGDGTTAADIGLKGQIFGNNFQGAIIYRGGNSDLSQIGLTTTTTGKLEFNKGKFETAMNNDPDAVKNLLTADVVGFAARFRKSMSTYTAFGSGAIDAETKSITTKIEGINGQIQRYLDRSKTMEQVLRRQFTALEVTLSQSQQISQLLTQKLSPSNGSN